MKALVGRFNIKSWQEQDLNNVTDGEKVKLAKVEQEYIGALLGSSSLEYRIFHVTDTLAEFIGIEYFKGHFEGHACEMVLHHKGQFSNGTASSHFEIVDIKVATINKGLPLAGTFETAERSWADYSLTS